MVGLLNPGSGVHQNLKKTEIPHWIYWKSDDY